MPDRKFNGVTKKFEKVLWVSHVLNKIPTKQPKHAKKIMGESMSSNEPHILEAYQHRSAGLEGQLNIETKELKSILWKLLVP